MKLLWFYHIYKLICGTHHAKCSSGAENTIYMILWPYFPRRISLFPWNMIWNVYIICIYPSKWINFINSSSFNMIECILMCSEVFGLEGVLLISVLAMCVCMCDVPHFLFWLRRLRCRSSLCWIKQNFWLVRIQFFWQSTMSNAIFAVQEQIVKVGCVCRMTLGCLDVITCENQSQIMLLFYIKCMFRASQANWTLL